MKVEGKNGKKGGERLRKKKDNCFENSINVKKILRRKRL